MARGRQTCKILKEIRRQIAEANGIEFATSECRFKGDCLGTCPKCEAEVRYLEEELRRRSSVGKAVVLAGISAAMIMTGCSGSASKDNGDEDFMGEVISDSSMLLQEEDSIYEGEMPELTDSPRIFPNENDEVIQGELG